MLSLLCFRREMLAQHRNGINKTSRPRVDDVMVRPVNRYGCGCAAVSKQQLCIAAVCYRGGGCGGGGSIAAARRPLRPDYSWRHDLLRDLRAGQTIIWKSSGERFQPC
ncbi:hypothetical protein Vafri_18990 [Volvox africanus]|uniref:Uncharacterized protein n=1 Tax=Volvox africanus TaxID=51714 RepID=A0A8J4FBP0_9CHLO|nr:hypothetical protein Vafri_18990 [Volvox africanus]